MELQPAVAQRVVERIASGLNTWIGVTDASGRVLASTRPETVGTLHPGASALLRGTPLPDTASEVVLPLEYADERVGALAVGVDPARGADGARVARMLAELFIHQSAVLDQLPHQPWARDKFIADLLQGRLAERDDGVLQEAWLFDVDLRLPRVVVVFDIAALAEPLHASAVGSLPAISRALRREQWQAQLLERVAAANPGRSGDVAGVLSDRLLALLANTHAGGLDGAVERILAVLGSGLDHPVAAGVGRCYPGWKGLAQSFQDACCALETGQRLYGPGKAYRLEQLGLAAFVASDDHGLKAGLAHDLLAPLDAEPDLLETLAAFLAASLSPSQTAQALTIHRHTLAYRLDKIARLTGLDPRDFAAAATLQSALIVRRLGATSA